jgi:hypothetical protein
VEYNATNREERSARMAKPLATDQVSFYDETLNRQIEGSYRTDGKSVHVRSAKYGIKSAPYGHLGTFIDQDGQHLLAQKLLSELAREAGKAIESH